MTDGLLVEETYINRTENCGIGESGIYESWMETPGEAYREFVRLYGRCQGKVWVDGPDGKPVHVGWVFVKRQKYDDSPETFLRETWITLHAKRPERTVEHFHLSISEATKTVRN